MNDKHKARQVVDGMMRDDAFSRWLGIEVEEVADGYARLRMKVREDMLNGFGVCHGGVTFSLADSALAFASNSYGRLALALENNISFTQKVEAGDILAAETRELSSSARIAVYQVTVTNQHGETVAEFRGTVYKTRKEHQTHQP